jgi:hypothetical protein
MMEIDVSISEKELDSFQRRDESIEVRISPL